MDGRTSDEIWAQISERAEKLRRSGTLLPTISTGVRNRIVRVESELIERESELPRTDRGTSVVRKPQIARVWDSLRRNGYYDGDELRFARALFQLVDGVAVKGGQLRLETSVSPPAYWWSGDRAEHFWVEIRHLEGIGSELRCPTTDNAWYRLVDNVREGDIVYHWHARESRFVGRSKVATSPLHVNGERVVPLVGFRELAGMVDLQLLRARSAELYKARESIAKSHPGVPHYLPFQYRQDGIRMMSNYFAKISRALVVALFGQDGWATSESLAPPQGEGADDGPLEPDVRSTFLNPFKPKADAAYVALVRGGVQRRGRHHETLVNDFQKWLTTRGLTTGRNAAIDLGTEQPPVIVEAKVVTNPVDAIRQAVGQLYEYRFFHAGPKGAALVYLASKEVDQRWIEYLENDRKIGVAWPEDDGFALSRHAQEAFAL